MNISEIQKKNTGDPVYAAEFNAITGTFPIFATYTAFKTAAQTRGLSADPWIALVLSDTKNNGGNLTLYIYVNGKLNWCATTPTLL